jgi:hypothetical protein
MKHSPILLKAEPRPNQDYKPMTWIRFLKIRSWAQTLADELKAPVYLVGSVLDKDIPRDIDISVIFPVKVYEELFGKIPTSTNDFAFTQKVAKLMDEVHLSKPRLKAYFDIMSAIGHETMIDLKFCPDTWWTDKDKMLLAEPRRG